MNSWHYPILSFITAKATTTPYIMFLRHGPRTTSLASQARTGPAVSLSPTGNCDNHGFFS